MTSPAFTAALAADDVPPTLRADVVERLALAVSARLRGRLFAAETRIEAALTDDERFLAQDAADELVWLLGRIDLHVAIARDSRGGMVELDPALHEVLTASGKLAPFPTRRSPAPEPGTRAPCAAGFTVA